MQKIAVIFDFDDTLAPDSTSALLEDMGIDARKFWQETVQPLDNADWDPIPAYLYSLIELSNSSQEYAITKEKLISFAHRLKFHTGVTRIFDLIREHLRKADPEIGIEFYLISSGIGEIARNTKIAKHFTDIWASEFIYDVNGKIKFPKKVVSFTDKTRYIFQISKGIIGSEARGNPFEVNKRMAYKDFRIKLEHMIFVGDGLTDVPCFSLIRRYNGITIGVYDRHRKERWGKAWNFIEEGRVTNLLSANYSSQSDLTSTLMMAVEGIARKIKEQ
jgi:2-hydroxy-3-keto-5-methylthiopentenyl-1-phosphate phosphatase